MNISFVNYPNKIIIFCWYSWIPVYNIFTYMTYIVCFFIVFVIFNIFITQNQIRQRECILYDSCSIWIFVVTSDKSSHFKAAPEFLDEYYFNLSNTFSFIRYIGNSQYIRHYQSYRDNNNKRDVFYKCCLCLM